MEKQYNLSGENVNIRRCLLYHKPGCNVLNMNFAERMKSARKHSKKSQKQIEEETGVTQQMISKLETGISMETSDIVKLAIAYGVNPVWLSEGSGEMLASCYIIHETNPLRTDHLSKKKQVINELMDELTETQKDKLIHIAKEWAGRNQEVLTELSRPTRKNNAD